MSTTLEGAIVPLITPFDDEGALHRPTLTRLTQHFLAEGADALMPTALSGEGPLLSEQETLDVWETVFEATSGAKPVLPAIISFTTKNAARLAQRAEALGAEGLMVAPLVPELYAGRAERDVIGFYEELADATSLPIILFNYPSLTGVNFTAELVEKLAAIDSVRYIKESTGDSKRVSAITRRLGERVRVICGSPHAALESMALGCTAWITGILNVVPRSGPALLSAIHKDRDLAKARKIYWNVILPLVDFMERTNNPTGVIKAGLRAQELPVGVPRAPGRDLERDDLASFNKALEQLLAYGL